MRRFWQRSDDTLALLAATGSGLLVVKEESKEVQESVVIMLLCDALEAAVAGAEASKSDANSPVPC